MIQLNRSPWLLLGLGGSAALAACSGSDRGELFGKANNSLVDPAVAQDAGDVPGAAPFTRPLRIPPVLAPSSSDDNSDSYRISIRPGLAQMKAGAQTPIVGFNGVSPGPTLVATRGKTVQVTQTNDWSEDVTIHNHGHKVAAASDGHPTDYITPGASKVYTYPNDQRAGTYWYHDHAMDLTGPHVYQGLAGFYIITDPAEEALGLPSGDHDLPLLLQDKTFNSDNSLAYEPDHRAGFFGDTAVVNGTTTPYLDVGTSKYRFRVLNGSNARPYFLKLQVRGSSTAQPFQVIASDGGLLAAPVERTSLPIAPAERYDIVVDFSKYPLGTQLDLINTAPAVAGFVSGGADWGDAEGAWEDADVEAWAGFGAADWDSFGGAGPGFGGPGFGGPRVGAARGGGPGARFGWADGEGLDGPLQVPALTGLMEFVVTRSEADSSRVPSLLSSLQRLRAEDAVDTKQIVFRYDGSDWTLNDLTYDPERIDLSSTLDQVYVWTLTNESPIPHPFHKHLSQFNVLDINGAAPPAYESGWKDTVMVPPLSTVRIVFKEETFTGTYVFHCHNLEHEDHGMMLQEGVVR
ncbi:MAG TPA: multicopper oxidase domain-containing protein [Polyangiaceae bacterium]|nr:multicopper oxidase domain-containing protein [Polyangiaceae bacterium]